jgi:acetyl esterase/lipase
MSKEKNGASGLEQRYKAFNKNVRNKGAVDTGENHYVDPAEVVEAVKKGFPWFRIEDGRDDFVRQGSAYAHPLAVNKMSLELEELLAESVSPLTPLAEHKATQDSLSKYYEQEWKKVNDAHPEWEEFGYWEEYRDVPPCVEEPNAPKGHVLVRRLRESFKKGPHPVIFVTTSAGMYQGNPYNFSNAPLTKYLGAQIITPRTRLFPDAPYPAAINDLHAAYQWMIEHAEELDIDTDKIIIWGSSAAGLLAAAFPFRIKRYNYCGGPMPRGVITEVGFFDDRETKRSNRLISRNWSGLAARSAAMRYMGENFASNFIGPEAFANHATVDECRGLPPYLIRLHQDDVSTPQGLEFYTKLIEADVYSSLLVYGGSNHAEITREGGEQPFIVSLQRGRTSEFVPILGEDAPAINELFIVGSFKELLRYDFRRQFEE